MIDSRLLPTKCYVHVVQMRVSSDFALSRRCDVVYMPTGVDLCVHVLVGELYGCYRSCA
jgi:hypothetical protein